MKTMSMMLAALAVCACKSSMGQVEVASRARAQSADTAARESVVNLGDLGASDSDGTFLIGLARGTDAVIPDGVALTSLERVPVRSRASRTTVSAWRLEASSDHGSGAIFLIELPSQAPYYVGEGVFFGWSQEKLASTYRALAPVASGAEIDLPQLG